MQNAISIVVVIIGGILAGVLVRRRQRLVRGADVLALAAVFVLLFLLGLDMGSREDVIGNLGRVGLEAGMISAAAMVGSLLMTSVVWVVWFRKDRR